MRTTRLLCVWATLSFLVLVVAPIPAEAVELSAGVSLGGIQAGIVPRLAVSPHARPGVAVQYDMAVCLRWRVKKKWTRQSCLLSSQTRSLKGLIACAPCSEWIDAGTLQAPPVDGVTLREAMGALEKAMREIMYGGRISGGLPVTEEDLARVIRLEELMAEWTSTGALSPRWSRSPKRA